MFPALYFFYFKSLIPLVMATGPLCNLAEQSVSGKALKGHTYKSKRVQNPYECWVFCDSEVTCKSYNYVKTGKICELNYITEEEKPEDFVQDETRFYTRKWKNRGRYILCQVLKPIHFTLEGTITSRKGPCN